MRNFWFVSSPLALLTLSFSVALVILRLWKIFRAVHAIAHALEMHYQEGMFPIYVHVYTEGEHT